MSERATSLDLRWGIVGPGSIASVFCDALRRAQVGRVVHVAGRHAHRTEAFAALHDIERTSTTDQLMAASDIDVVYIATPHTSHAEFAIAALSAGKAVLCEKPLTMSPEDTARVLHESEENNAPLMEAWMYRAHPQIERLRELIEGGTIGCIRHVAAAFGAQAHGSLPERILRPELGGGVVYDIGGYPMSAALCVAEAESVRRQRAGLEHPTVERPTVKEVRARWAPTGVELHAELRGTINNSIDVELACSTQEDLGMRLRVTGSDGVSEMPAVFLPEGSRSGVKGEVRISNSDGERTEHPTSDQCCFSLEAREMARMIQTREREPASPCVRHSESAMIADGLQTWWNRVRACSPAEKNTESAQLDSGGHDARNA